MIKYVRIMKVFLQMTAFAVLAAVGLNGCARSDRMEPCSAGCSARAIGDHVLVSFRGVERLRVCGGGDVTSAGLDLAGEDGVWHPARIVNVDASGRVFGRQLQVRAPDVLKPVAVRYLPCGAQTGVVNDERGVPLAAFTCQAERDVVGNFPEIVKEGTFSPQNIESNPFVFKGKAYVWEFVRPDNPANALGGKPYSQFRELDDLTKISKPVAVGYYMSCAHSDGTCVHVTMTDRWGSLQARVFVAESSDLVNWSEPRPILEMGASGYNTSVCRAGDRYVMVYELGGKGDGIGIPFTMFFAESKDFRTWTKIPGASFGEAIYTGSPCLKWHGGWFYFFYLHRDERDAAQRPLYRMRVVRSRDLKNWECGNRVVLDFGSEDQRPHPGVRLDPEMVRKLAAADNRNASDIDMCDVGNDLVITYGWGNQKGFDHLALARVRGMDERAFCESFFKSQPEKTRKNRKE